MALLRQNESGAERVLTVVNTQEFEPREVAAEDLLASAGLSHLGNRIARCLAVVLHCFVRQVDSERCSVASAAVGLSIAFRF